LVILNYAVTSNHIHLLVVGGSERDVIPNSIKLIAGRTGQEFNQRKNRKGAFWEDRYHATAIENGNHLLRCLVYIDLNMVRMVNDCLSVPETIFNIILEESNDRTK
jgi:putative transposase